jgi:hypothetical protein
MRTTIRLDDELVRRAKRLAARQETTLTAVFEEALKEKLARSEGAELPRERPSLPTFGGRGPRPGVDLHDGSALLDLMDRADT